MRGNEAEAIADFGSQYEPIAQSAERASSLTQPASLPLAPPRVAVTDSEPYSFSPVAARRPGGLLSSLAEGRHVTGHHPSLATAREGHHEAAGKWGAPLIRSTRLAWGYGVHLPVKSALMLTEWVLETPLRFLSLVIVIALTYFLVIR